VRIKLLATIGFVLLVCKGNLHADVMSYTGTFSEDDTVRLFNVTLTAPATLTARTWSFAGGVNGAFTTIPPGGFSPDLWIFDSGGNLLLADTPESPHHAAPGDCGPRPIDPGTRFCWDAYIGASLPAGSYTVALTQDGNSSDGFLADGFSEQGNPNYTDVLSLGGFFYLPDGVTERNGHWAVDITGSASATSVPEPSAGLLLATAAMLAIAIRRPARKQN
jgi:hypothetical protein